MQNFPYLQFAPIAFKKVLIRVDFNVPIDKERNIIDDTRIKESLPTIQHLLKNNCSVIIMSHFGRPTKIDPYYSLDICKNRLEQLLHVPVILAPSEFSQETQLLAQQLQPKQVLLLENLRFHPGEENPKKYPELASFLASLGEFYVNDAFGCSHRDHSSISTIANYFPGNKAAGFLLQKEIQFLGNSFKIPQRPFCAIIGGKKVSSKLGTIQSLLHKVNSILIAGGMAYTFLKAKGMYIGNSICEDSLLETAKEILKECQDKGVELILPVDLVCADRFSNEANTAVIDLKTSTIPKDWVGMDIGPKTISLFKNYCSSAKIIFWNGPLGVCEFSKFSQATKEIAHILSQVTGVTIVGGGDSIAQIKQQGLSNAFNHLSTGGGASLEYIERGSLPGIDSLLN